MKTSLGFHDIAFSVAERRDLRSPRVEVTVAVSRLGDVELTHLAPAVIMRAYCKVPGDIRVRIKKEG